jgi:release factor glutamine methyltransferase
MAEPTTTPVPTVWTIKALLAWTTDFLTKKGIENPRADAQILLGHVLGYTKTYLAVNFAEQPSEADRNC